MKAFVPSCAFAFLVALSTSLFPLRASAYYGENETETVDGITWSYVVYDSYAVIQGDGEYVDLGIEGGFDDYASAIDNSTSGAIVVPSTLGGFPVAAIGESAFEGCSGLTSITIPNSVTSIGGSAFSGCSGLTSIAIPNGVTSIGGSAFSGCSGLKSITIPDGVVDVESGLFYGCTGLISPVYNASKTVLFTVPSSRTGAFSIPNGVTEIGYGAFYDCSGLTSISIPNGVTRIGGFAFYGCSGLTSISIPTSVTEIGYGAFDSCSGLTSISIPTSVTRIGNSAFSGCSRLTSIVIPDSVTSIGYRAFYNCSGLTSIVIPDSVTSIENRAFDGCSGLTSISIPTSVTEIGYGAFYDCSGLTSISIPNGVTSIGNSAFSGCSGLTSVTIPNSVTSIEPCAFSRCSKLVEVIVGGSLSLSIDSFPSCVQKMTFYKAAPTLIRYTESWDGFYESSSPYTGMLGDLFPNCTVYAAPDSTGWRTSIPGWWRELPIQHLPPATPAPVVSATTYTVRFAANGGSGKMSAQKLAIGKAAALRKNAFTRKGWVFLGWAKTKTGAVAYKNAQSVKNLAAAGKTVTLYAKWAKKSYKVKFVANGGKGKMAVQKMTYGKAKRLSANKFKRAGYVFKGWATSKSNAKKGKVKYKNKKSVKNLVANGKTVKLYAVWRKKK